MATIQQATGIDVSHYKKQIDWRKVKASGVQFAFIKATEADNFIDSRFDYNWSRTRREGIIRGAYHFFRPLVDPVRQANNFIKIAGRTMHKTDLPPVLDVESYPDFVGREWKQISLDERLRRIQIWLQTVETATGRIPIIYTEYYAWRDFIGNTEKFVRYPLWIANYRVESPKVPANNWGGNGWTLWQTTEKGVVAGIRDEAPCVDMDVFRGSFEELESWLKIDAPRAQAPDVTNGDMMAALIDTADLLHISSDDLVNRACLRYLIDPIGNSQRPYDGPAVEDLSLTAEEKSSLSKVLEKYIGKNSYTWCINHQDLINAFYAAASPDGKGGWSLVEKTGLDYIGDDRAAIYNGPTIDQLPGLTEMQKAAIADALGLANLENAEPVVTEEEVEEPVNVVEEELPEVIPVDEEERVVVEPEIPVTMPVVEPEVEPEYPQGNTQLNTSATYGNQVDNQAIINAFYLAAIKLDQNGREMIAAAELGYLVDVRMDVYTGPRIEELPGLSRVQREMIAELLGIKLKESLMVEETELVVPQPPLPEEEATIPAVEVPAVEPSRENILEQGSTNGNLGKPTIGEPVQVTKPSIQPTYPGLVNQDLINLFYRVAALFGENGWQWLVKCGLAAIGATRQLRFEDYKGPNIKSIPGLTDDQKDLLEREVNQLKFV